MANPAPMPIPYRLAAVDLDDTLLGPDKLVSAANRRAVSRLQSEGCRVVLASGRRHQNMVHYCRELGLDDYTVSCQGARVQHVGTGEVLHLALVPAQLAREAEAVGASLGLMVVIWLQQGIFVCNRSPWTADYASQTGGEPLVYEPVGSASGHGVEKMVWAGEPARVSEAAEAIRARLGPGLALTEAHPWCLELAHPDANKAAGVASIARRGGIAREQVLAFGDGYNDVPLLRWAGLGVAMPHGRESARQSAHRVGAAGESHEAFARAVDEVLAPTAAAGG